MKKNIFISGILFLLIIFPLIVVFIASFGSGETLSFPPKDFSIDYYKGLIVNEEWSQSLLVSLKICFISILFSVPFGISILWYQRFFIERNTFKYKVIQLVSSIPLVVPPILLGIGFFLITRKLGIPGNWFVLGIINSLIGIPIVIIIVGIALRRFPMELIEASAICGAKPFNILRTIILPYFLPSIIISSVIIFMITFEELVIALYVSNANSVPISVKFWSSIKYYITPYVTSATVVLISIGFLVILSITTMSKNKYDH